MTTPKKSTTKTHPHALIHLDTKKLRKNVLDRFNRNKAKHASLNAEVEQFEKEDLPAFRKWIHNQCKELQEESNTLRSEHSALRKTLELTDDLCEFYPRRTSKLCADAAVHYIETEGNIPDGFDLFFRELEHRTSSDRFSNSQDEPNDEEDFSEDCGYPNF